ncbi:MAG: peptidoglycan editing factor PgeF [Alphaproteobacteria bacterium]|jgi:YfiH family protein|nr:peptidoglycan editing factor PgeF [Alphaproteobacteria bacterium]
MLPEFAETLPHAFFSREGGVSEGLYAARNCGFGSGDARENVARNRALCLDELGVPGARLLTLNQVHSPEVVVADAPWEPEEAPRADALVTDRPGLALGILTADCAPVLLTDPEAGVIGAAHAGWKGARAGVLARTLAAMAALGARPARIRAAIGPCIGPDSYEVSGEFRNDFLADDPGHDRFFRPAPRAGHALFDLPGYCRAALSALGIAAIATHGADTLADDRRWFSYRRSVLRGEPDYGRCLSVICLPS